jgi:hypothetical protein
MFIPNRKQKLEALKIFVNRIPIKKNADESNVRISISHLDCRISQILLWMLPV